MNIEYCHACGKQQKQQRMQEISKFRRCIHCGVILTLKDTEGAGYHLEIPMTQDAGRKSTEG